MIRSPRIMVLGVLALALMMFVTLPAFAKDIEGTLTSIDGAAKVFVIADRYDGEHRFRLAPYGKVIINDEEAQLADLRAEDEVTVAYEMQEDEKLATTVRCTRMP